MIIWLSGDMGAGLWAGVDVRAVAVAGGAIAVLQWCECRLVADRGGGVV